MIGAGPVGLCLCAGAGPGRASATCLIEALGGRQFPRPDAARRHQSSGHARDVRPDRSLPEDRAARHHRADLPLLGPSEAELVAEFDHACLKDDTRFPYVLQCERIKIVEEALTMAKAHPDIEVRLATDVHGVRAGRRRRHRPRHQCGRRGGDDRGPLYRERGGRAQHHPQGSRHRVRGLHLSGPHAQHRGRLRFPPARLRGAQLHFRSGRVVEPVSLERPARSLARAFPDRSPTTIRDAIQRPEALQARLQASCRPAAITRSAAATSTRCTSGSRRSSAPAARSWPAIPPM